MSRSADGSNGNWVSQNVRGSKRMHVLAPARRLVEKLAKKLNPFGTMAYSQDGEDLVLNRLFGGAASGFYVDVGAHHPFRFSNTCIFYERGWRGINIDANPVAIAEFEVHRPRDINVCSGIGDVPGTMDYHCFNDPALNTFDTVLARERNRLPGYKMVSTHKVAVQPLRKILDEALPSGQRIDFITIDVEGFDLAVLRSNDWSRYRPRFLVVEARALDLADVMADPACAFASAQGYRPVAKTVNSVFLEMRAEFKA